MKCPDIETLIAIASGKGDPAAADVILHVAECSECRQNMKIIHETMMAPKWLNPKVEVVHQPDLEENCCSVCGTHYRSKSSLRQTCMEKGCRALICFDCWSKGVRKCATHAEPSQKK